MNGLVYMLDTNILSDTIRNPFGIASQYMERIGEDALCVSAIVASEMRYGIRKKGSPRLSYLVENTLSRIAILPYDDAASQSYSVIRDALKRQGKSIGLADLFIAAHAYSLGLPIVTNNVREFSRVDGLKIENWLATEERP